MGDAETAALPPGWAWAKLGDICDIVGGATVDAKRRGPDLVELPYLRVANVQRGRLDLSVMKQIAVPQAQAKRLRLLPGDVLLNEGGDRDKVGRGWVWEGQIENCIFQNHVFRARPRHESIQPRWLSHYLNEAARPYFLSGSKQTTNLASLSLTKVAATPVAVPPANEQRRLVAVIEALLSEVDDVEAAMKRAGGQMADYRASLLHAACTGALTADWRVANPHPAEDGSALLRRILAERRAAWEQAELVRFVAADKSPRERWQASYPEPRLPPETHQFALPEGWALATLDQLLGGSPRNGISVKGRSEPPGTPALRLDALGDDRIYYDRCRYIDISPRQAAALTIQGSCSSPPVDLECLALRVRQLDVTGMVGIQGWDDASP